MVRMFLVGLVAGVAGGIGAGWLLFSEERVVYRDASRREVVTVPADRPRAGDGPEDDPDLDPDRLDGVEVEDASTEELAASSAPVTASGVEALIQRIDRARADRDWNEFQTLLGLLGSAGTGRAHEKLVELMGDPTLGFRANMGRRFFAWLKDAQVPGIVEAARVRLDRETQGGTASSRAYEGWLALVAQHGGPGDLAWIDQLGADPKTLTVALDAWIAAGARPVAAQRVAALFAQRTRPWFASRLQTFAHANGDATRQLVEGAYASAKLGERDDLARAYGEAVDEKSLGAAKRFLGSITDPAAQIDAVFAVDRMAQRGLDTSGLESIALAPVIALENLAGNPGRNQRDLTTALNAVRMNRITWSPRAVSAIEAAAASADTRMANSLKLAAARIRNGLGEGDWK
jgi:hypothetical protein